MLCLTKKTNYITDLLILIYLGSLIPLSLQADGAYMLIYLVSQDL